MPLLIGLTTPFGEGTPHFVAPVKLSDSDAAKMFCGTANGPPSRRPCRLPPTSLSGMTSVPCDLPTPVGNHLTTSETGVVAALAATEDEVLGALDADQRETLYQLLAQATPSHVVDCASAAAELLSNDGC